MGLEIAIFVGSVILLDQVLENGFNLVKEDTMRIRKITQPNVKTDVPLSYEVLEKYLSGQVIKKNVDKLEEAFQSRNLTYFHNNINNLKIKTSVNRLSKLFSRNELGNYSPFNNRIEIGSIQDESVLTHELLHVASTTKEFGRVYSGFSQYRKYSSFGNGLNEGYTELLNNRYFLDKKSKRYYHEQIFAKCIEKLVGKSQMEYYYLIGELKYLCEDLLKYYNEKEIEQIIVSLDIINHYSLRTFRTIHQKQLLNKAFKTSSSLIDRGLKQKLEEDGYQAKEVDSYYKITNIIKEQLRNYGLSDDTAEYDQGEIFRKALEKRRDTI